MCEAASGWRALHSHPFLCNVSQVSRPGSYRFRPQSSAGFWPLCRFSVAGDTFLTSLWPSGEHNRTVLDHKPTLFIMQCEKQATLLFTF